MILPSVANHSRIEFSTSRQNVNDLEEVIRRNPDVIIDMGHNEMVTESQKRAVKQLWKKYSFLRAIQRDTVFPVSADYFVTPGPRIVEAVRDIRRMIGK